MKNKLPIADCRLPIENRNGGRHAFQIENRKSKIVNGFTLIELLTVITIIGVLAAFLFPAMKGIKQQQYRRTAQAEMEQLETAIERYKAAYGFYPPDNPANPLINQLYFELLGTTNTAFPPAPPLYQSLDDPNLPSLSQGNVTTIFGVSGFMNCNKPGAGEDVRAAQDFLPGLKSDQLVIFTNSSAPNNPIKLIVTSVRGPDGTYTPLGPNAMGINPWRYNSSNPTNNPGAYDLWVQLSISGRTNLICNWSKAVLFNRPLP